VITLLVPAGGLAPGAAVSLDREEAHHVRVRRVRPGDPVRLVDGHGRCATGRLSADGRVELDQVEQLPRPVGLGLAVGAGDRDRFGWLVEKAAELGVTDVIPLETERTAGVSSRVRGEHIEKLQRRALEAIKPSGSAWAPVVHLPHTIAELIARHRQGIRWLADAQGESAKAPGATDQVLIVVGPEGGFTGAERTILIDEGWLPVRFGGRTLRFETAALAGAVLAGAGR
jgi:16S rRNA (uracil1498-N3)-methyltransferase